MNQQVQTSIAEPAIAPGVMFRMPCFWAMQSVLGVGADEVPFIISLAEVGP